MGGISARYERAVKKYLLLDSSILLTYCNAMISVKHYMLDAGWGQAELAKALNINYSYVSLILAGKRIPSVETLKRLSDVTGIGVDTLVKEAGQKPPRKRPIPRTNGSAP
jgi:ribosome-binding protein aMBF1 (putative translation factor)